MCRIYKLLKVIACRGPRIAPGLILCLDRGVGKMGLAYAPGIPDRKHTLSEQSLAEKAISFIPGIALCGRA